MKRLLAVGLATLFVSACGGDSTDDAGVTPDAGPTDTGDTTPTDSGVEPDAGPTDTGVEPDAGPPDTGVELVESGGPCVQDGDCESGLCVAFGRQPYCTERCNTASDCGFSSRNMVCENFREQGDICMFDCSDSADCGEDPELGAGVCIGNVEMGDDTTEDLCVYVGGKYCTSDADCVADGDYCTITGGGLDYVNVCYPENVVAGRLRPGEACPQLDFDIPCRTTNDCPRNYTCDTDSDTCDPSPQIRCASFNCGEGGTCLDVCSADGDCATGQACQGNRFVVDANTEDDTSDDRFAQIGWCFPFQGSQASCVDDSACPGGEFCHPFTNLSIEVGGQCRAPESYDATFEAQCADDPDTIEVVEPDSTCTSGLCLYGSCSRLCDAEADCGAGYRCLDVDSTGEGTPDYGLCVPGASCVRDSDCGAGDYCGALDTNIDYVGVCRPGAGGIASGGSCDPFDGVLPDEQVECQTTADCANVATGNWLCSAATGFCAPPNSERCDTFYGCREGMGGFCSSRCAADADCAGPDFLCAGTRVTLSNNGTPDSTDDVRRWVGFCEAVPGSRTPCVEESDCTAANESCVFVSNLDGTGRTLCTSAYAHYPNDIGADCGIIRNQLELCKTGYCDFNDGRFAVNLGTCAGYCSDDADCPTGLTCQDLDFTDENFARKACRRPRAF